MKILSILEVPNVVGEEPQQGIDIISDANLKAEMELKWLPGDRIARQVPDAGRTVQSGSTVTLWFGREAPD